MHVALAAVIAVISLLGGIGVTTTTFAPPAHADAVGPVTVVIDRLTPVVPRPDGRLRVEGRVVNTTSNAMDDVVIRLRLSSEPVTRRTQITRVRQSPLDTENQEPTPEQLDQRTAPDSWPEPADAIVEETQINIDEAISPRGQAAFAIRIPFEDLPLAEPGVYALAIEVLGSRRGATGEATDERQGMLRTFLPWFPEPVTPLQMVWLWPLADWPAQNADGVFLDSQTPDAIAPGGRLTSLVETGARQPRSVNWIADPALLQSVQDMSDGYQILRGGQVVVGDRSDEATAWLSSLTDALNDARPPTTTSPVLRVLPYADIDASAVNRAGMPTDVVRAVTSSAPLSSVTLDQQVIGGTYWAPFGRIDPETADLVASAGVRTIILSGRAIPARDAYAGANTGRAVLSTSVGAVQAVLREPRMSALLTEPQRNRSDAIEIRQAFLAESGVLAGTIPEDAASRAVVVGPDDIRWDPSGTVVNALLKATVTAPWMKPLTLTDLLDEPVNPLRRDRRDYGKQAKAAELPDAYMQDVRRTSDELAAFTSVLDNPIGISDTYAAALLRAESSAWRSEPTVGASLLNNISTQLSEQVAQIGVLSEGTVTFSGDSGRVPITIENSLDRTVTVGVQLRASPAIRLESEPLQGIQVEPGKKVSVDIEARVVGGNTLPVRVQLLTPDGTVFGEGARIDVASTAYARAAAWVVIVAFIAIVIFVVIGVARRIRLASTSGSSNSGDSDDPSDPDNSNNPIDPNDPNDPNRSTTNTNDPSTPPTGER